MVRKGIKTDIPIALELIKELAAYEKGLEQVTTTVAQMEKDGFGKNPLFEFYVVEDGGKVVGLALYYFRYSTWQGKQLYLEDIIVTENKRGQGWGKLLFDKMIEVSNKENCHGMVWQVLDWNKPAIEFYKKYGAELDPEWVNCQYGRR